MLKVELESTLFIGAIGHGLSVLDRKFTRFPVIDGAGRTSVGAFL
jgi:hypothetical protein